MENKSTFCNTSRPEPKSMVNPPGIIPANWYRKSEADAYMDQIEAELKEARKEVEELRERIASALRYSRGAMGAVHSTRQTKAMFSTIEEILDGEGIILEGKQ